MRRSQIVCALLLLPGAAAAQVQFPDPAEFFETRVRPVLAENCFACHTDSALGGLKMTSHESLLKGGHSGPAVMLGQPDRSLLIQAVRHTHERFKMPPQGRLSDAEIAGLAIWIERGAYWPPATEAKTGEKARSQGKITPEQRNFWSFRPVAKPEAPEVSREDWARTPIDRFILARLEANGLEPAPSASKRILLRRAYLDLIGLPPTPKQIDAFLADDTPGAFASVVEELLGSRHYGERWGRIWLDVARYSDDKLNSTEMEPYENAFRYRDWVIQAFNDDMPYDLFVQAQIAGDLLDPDQTDRLAPGLGFYGLSPNQQDDRIDATTRGFLGLTAACAQCHDHKFDPIPTEDYYALLGIFNSSEPAEYPLASPQVVERYEAQEMELKEAIDLRDEFVDTQSKQLAAILAAESAQYLAGAWLLMGPGRQSTEEVALDRSLDLETLERWVRYLDQPGRYHPFLDDWDAMMGAGGSEEQARKLGEELEQLLAGVIQEKKEVDQENVIRTQGGKISRSELGKTELASLERDRFFLWRDLVSHMGFQFDDDVKFESGVLYYSRKRISRFLAPPWKQHLAKLEARIADLRARMPEHYPFAHAVADKEEPGNERVRIRGNENRLGDEVPRGFLTVLSPPDRKPFTHGSGRLELAKAVGNADNPLTARVMVNRVWLQHFGAGLVRTPSNFGQMGERPTHPELLDYLAARFVENGWSIKALHREIMTSATYQLSSLSSSKSQQIDPSNRWLSHYSPRRLDFEALRDSVLFVSGELDRTPGGLPDPLHEACSNRRTVYGYVSRRRLDTTLGLFDFPNPNNTSPRRVATNTPLQALFFLNSEFMMEQAGYLARRLEREAGQENDAKMNRLYRLLFGRKPRAEEAEAGRKFVAQDPGGWPSYTQVLLTSNEFLFLN